MTATHTTAATAPRHVGRVAHDRAFLVVWQHPQTRAFARVGRLEVLADRYRFRYDQDAADVPGFEPFLAFPDLDGSYVSQELFPFFSNRVLSARRPDFPLYLQRLGLDGVADPVEILARSGGGRATDTVHLVPEPVLTPEGAIELRFLASGVRHADPDGSHLRSVSAGDVLVLREDHGNPANPRALLLDTESGRPVGWVPDYLVDVVQGLRETCQVQVVADIVNTPDTPAHLRLLCLLRAHPLG